MQGFENIKDKGNFILEREIFTDNSTIGSLYLNGHTNREVAQYISTKIITQIIVILLQNKYTTTQII